MKNRIFILVLVLAMLLGACAFAESDDALYLETYYNVPAFAETVSVEAFNDALSALGQEPIAVETLTLKDAVVAAVKLAGMSELAEVYVKEGAPDMAFQALQACGIKVDDDAAPYVACALDLELVGPDDDFNGALKGEDAAKLLYKAAEMNGMGRRYIGMISDDDILTALRTNLDAQAVFEDDELNNLGMEIIMQNATTGYNLKYAANDAHFLPERTLRYGHSDIAHAIQLVALLRANEFDGYLQVEPKVSVYEYMIEWGDPGAPMPTYGVYEAAEGRYLAYATEYDLVIEFKSSEEKEAFHGLIETYAKKYDDSFDADGNMVEKLLTGSWWQPLYYSETEMENEEYGVLYNNIIYNNAGNYYIQSLCVEENLKPVSDVIAAVTPNLTADARVTYVNPAFIRYITGTDHQ